MGDGVTSDVRRREELGLIKAFLRIRDPDRRRRILALAEQLADEAASEAAGLAFAATDASLADAAGNAAGQTD